MKLEAAEIFEEDIDVCGFDDGQDILVLDNSALTNIKIKQEVVDCASPEVYEIPQDQYKMQEEPNIAPRHPPNIKLTSSKNIHVPPTYVPMLPWMLPLPPTVNPQYFCFPPMLKHSAMENHLSLINDAMLKSPTVTSPPAMVGCYPMLSPPAMVSPPPMLQMLSPPPIMSPPPLMSPPPVVSPQSMFNTPQLFQCDLCDTEFYDRTTLTIHKRHVHGGRQFKCKHCGKSFSKKWNLRVHINIHTGETPYPCSICSKGFSNPNAMRKHKQKCKPHKKQAKL